MWTRPKDLLTVRYQVHHITVSKPKIEITFFSNTPLDSNYETIAIFIQLGFKRES